MTEKTVMMIKLISGEEILGEVDEKTVLYNGRVSVRNPDRIILQPDPKTGQLGIILLDFIPYAKDKDHTIDINDNAIAFKSDVAPELAKNYKERHSSIIMPTQPIVNLRV